MFRRRKPERRHYPEPYRLLTGQPPENTYCRNRGHTRSLQNTNAAAPRNEAIDRMTNGSDNEQALPGQTTTTSTQTSTPSPLVTALQREHPDWISEVREMH